MTYTARRLPEAALGLLFLIGLLAFSLHRIFAYDLWWQLATGQWVLAHGLPAHDPFSYAYPGRPWIEPRWLYCVLIHLLQRQFGLNALILGKAALLALTFFLLARVGRADARWAGWFGATLALAVAAERFLVRPELVSFFGLVLTLYLVERHRRGRGEQAIWLLPLWQVAWCNLHTLWILGPAVQWLLLAGDAVERRFSSRRRTAAAPEAARLRTRLRVALVSSLLVLLNPYGLAGVLFPLRLFEELGGAHYLGTAIEEFNSPLSSLFLGLSYRSLSYAVVIVLSAAGFALRGRRIDPARLILWLAFLFLALRAQRNVALFGLVAGYVTILHLEEFQQAASVTRARRLALGLSLLAALFLLAVIPLLVTDAFYRGVGSSKQFGFGVSDRRFPLRALAFARQQELPLPVLNSLGDGGYVLFEGGERSVLIDGRLEIYGEEILRQVITMTQTGEGVTALADRLGLRTVLVRNQFKDSDLLRRLESSGEWFPVYLDPLHLLYLRAGPATPERLRRLRLDWDAPVTREVELPVHLRPPDWLAGWWPRVADNFEAERLGSALIAVGQYDGALRQFEIAARQRPDDPRAALFLGLFYRALGREAEARQRLALVAADDLRRHDVEVLAGEIFMWARRPAQAVECFDRALRDAADDRPTRLRLARALIADGQHERATTTLQRLLESGEEDAEVWSLLGAQALRLARPDEAIRWLEQSLRLRPAQPRVLSMLCSAYQDAGRPAEARACHERRLDLDSPDAGT